MDILWSSDTAAFSSCTASDTSFSCATEEVWVPLKSGAAGSDRGVEFSCPIVNVNYVVRDDSCGLPDELELWSTSVDSECCAFAAGFSSATAALTE